MDYGLWFSASGSAGGSGEAADEDDSSVGEEIRTSSLSESLINHQSTDQMIYYEQIKIWKMIWAT